MSWSLCMVAGGRSQGGHTQLKRPGRAVERGGKVERRQENLGTGGGSGSQEQNHKLALDVLDRGCNQGASSGRAAILPRCIADKHVRESRRMGEAW
ncbi:hypothetical protein Hte_005755 [Hypoxylon texense]